MLRLITLAASLSFLWACDRKSSPSATLLPKAAYTLGNADDLHRKAPWTYSIPRRAERNAVKVGDLVKLVFTPSTPSAQYNAERMWVKVTSAQGSKYSGVLDNDPKVVTALHAGDPVGFGPEHIIAIYADRPGIDESLTVMVDRRILAKGGIPARARRDKPAGPTESGWWLLSRDEPDDFLKDPKNFVAKPIGELYRTHGTLDTIFDEKVGSRFIWNEATLEFDPMTSGK